MRKYPLILMALSLSLGMTATARADGRHTAEARDHGHRGHNTFYAFELRGDDGIIRLELARAGLLGMLMSDGYAVPARKERVHSHKRFKKDHRRGHDRARWKDLAGRALRRFARADANNDRFIDPREFRAAGKRHFDRADINGDGLISRAEFMARLSGAKGHGHKR